MQYNVKDDVHIAYMGEGQVKLIHAHVDQWNVYIMKTNCKEKQGVIIIGAIIVSHRSDDCEKIVSIFTNNDKRILVCHIESKAKEY